MDQRSPLGSSSLPLSLEEVYTEKVLSLARMCPESSSLDAPDISEEAYSRLCGSRVRVDLIFEKNPEFIAQIACSYQADVLAKAAISAVFHYCMPQSGKKRSRQELLVLCQAVSDMIQKGVPLPAFLAQDFEALALACPFKARHASLLLIFKALEKALKPKNGARGL